MIKKTNIHPAFVQEQRRNLGKQIHDKRIEMKMPFVEDLAELIGVTPNTVCKLELGLYAGDINLYIKAAIVLKLKISLI